MTRDGTLQPAEAWRLLFESQSVSSELRQARYLDGPKLKQAYRRRVFETHPDRARSLGADRTMLESQVLSINRAYKVLSALVRQGPVDTTLWRHRP